MIEVGFYKKEYHDAVVELILDIQQREFGLPVTIKNQPDLLDIENVYCSGKGNFWVALDGLNLIGTIALIDIGNRQAALRKMFVHHDYRGKKFGVGQLLLDTAIHWCNNMGIDEICLGTIDLMTAAHKFYRRNGFTEVKKHDLPQKFPIMPVDNMFFRYNIKK